MKKIISLLMVVAVVLTMSLTSFAAAPIQGMHTIITETDSDITVTVKVGNVVNFNGATTYLKTSAVTYAGSYELGDKVAGWTVTPTTNKAGYIKFVISTTDAASYITEAGEFEVISYKVAKADASATLSAADFAYGTGTLDVSKVTTPTGGTVAGQAAGNNFTSKKVPDYFTLEYVDARTPAPADDKWEADEEATIADLADLGTIEVAGEAVDYVRAVAIFGKNAAGTTYTVTFGANTYEGEAVVGQPWAMVLYDNGTAGRDLISSTAGSYAYTVNAGEATWSGTAAVITK